MAKRFVMLVTVFAAILPGCVQEATPGASRGSDASAPGNNGPAGDAAGLQVVAYEDCRGIEVVHAVDYDEAAAVTPLGFRPRPFLDEPSGTRATFVTQVGECDGVLVDGVPVHDSTRVHGFAILIVDPPAEHADAGIRHHALALRFAVGSDAELAPLAGGGLTTGAVANGAVALTTVANGVLAEGWLDAAGFAVTSRGGGDISAASGYSVRFYDITGTPAFDAVLQDFPSAVGPGTGGYDGVPFTTTGVGPAVARLPDGLFATFHPLD